MTVQTISRKGSFDSGHRVMNEKMKCFNLHGHTYLYKLTFVFNSIEDIGYAIDFKEIKRVACQWIDDLLDHGMILNPKDDIAIKATSDLEGKLWIMSLNGEGEYCNPSVENVAKEIFLAMECLFSKYSGLIIKSVEIHETPNCSTECREESISHKERDNWLAVRGFEVIGYADKMGILEYDDRKINKDEIKTN